MSCRGDGHVDVKVPILFEDSVLPFPFLLKEENKNYVIGCFPFSHLF